MKEVAVCRGYLVEFVLFPVFKEGVCLFTVIDKCNKYIPLSELELYAENRLDINRGDIDRRSCREKYPFARVDLSDP
jgi:hypothetical protein